jgi:hypothetical protein
MKTPYEKISKFGIDHYLFGKARKKSRAFYWILFVVYLGLAILAQWLLSA